jgi:hypothetical protein
MTRSSGLRHVDREEKRREEKRREEKVERVMSDFTF